MINHDPFAPLRGENRKQPPKYHVALSLALLVVCGCNGTRLEEGREPQPPSWLEGLPDRSIEATPGETVWAVVPEIGNEGGRLATYRLESAVGTEAVLVDALGNRHEGVPGALVHPVSSFPEAELAVGSAVLADRWDASGVVGRVTSLEEGRLELAYDWNGVTVTSAMDAVLALPAGEGRLVLRWVVYRAAGDETWYKGLCFAESDAKVWLITDGGHVEIADPDAVKPLAHLGRDAFEAGAAVTAYSWGHGFRPGVIEEVLEPGLRYAVKLPNGETRPVFFDSLTAETL